MIGDLAALHDLNSLAQLQRSKSVIIFIIINNQGGGIFSFLPYAQEKKFTEEYAALAHPWNFEAIAKFFQLPYLSLSNPLPLAQLFIKNQTMLVEFKSNRANNYAIHKRFNQQIKHRLVPNYTEVS